MRNILFIIFLIIGIHRVSAQRVYSISGVSKEKSNGEILSGAVVRVIELPGVGVSTNQYGFYSMSLKEGTYHIEFSFIGFKKEVIEVVLNQNQRIDIQLESQTYEGKEIEITADKADKNISSAQMGTERLVMDQIKNLPVVFGEVDVLKTLQLLPGVQSAGDGNTGFYVRGGGPDQNLILLDEAPVYNAGHLLGFFSVFNSDATKDATLIKGGIPANYGGRLSSVVDIKMKEGNNQSFHGQGGIGLIASRLMLEGPIKKSKGSFILAGRRTYLDALLKPALVGTKYEGTGYYFYDLNAKFNYELSNKDHLYASFYFGKDVFGFSNEDTKFNVKLPWGNNTASLRWNHIFNEKLFLNTTAIYSKYNFSTNFSQDNFKVQLYSGIEDVSLKTDFNYFPHVRHQVKFGTNIIYHHFTPSAFSVSAGGNAIAPALKSDIYGIEGAAYVMDEFDLSDRIKIIAGLRASGFSQLGPYNRLIQNSNNEITDTVSYARFKPIKTYAGLEPRLAVRLAINSKSSIKASYTYARQYLNLTSFAAISLPTDIWIPSSTLVKPQLGSIYSVGYFRNFFDNKLETSVELYYKEMENLVEYKNGIQPDQNVNNNVENNLCFGTGKSYGAEFFIKKPFGKFNGWIGYTLCWTTRNFPDLSNKEFYARYDRRHDISATLSYKLSESIDFAAIFVYASGNAITPTTGFYNIENQLVPYTGDRNSYRLPSYHRLDLSVNYNFKKRKRFESSINFSVFNVYNHFNVFFIYPATEGSFINGDLRTSAKAVSILPIIPSITWNFKF